MAYQFQNYCYDNFTDLAMQVQAEGIVAGFAFRTIAVLPPNGIELQTQHYVADSTGAVGLYVSPVPPSSENIQIYFPECLEPGPVGGGADIELATTYWLLLMPLFVLAYMFKTIRKLMEGSTNAN